MKFIIILFLAISCSTINEEDKFKNKLNNQECEKALIYNTPSSEMKFLKKTQKGVGTLASYTVTGLGYTGDLIAIFGGGIVVGVLACTPFLAIEAAAKSNGYISGQCFSKFGVPIMEDSAKLNLGKKTFENTKSWRCENWDKISQGMRKVAKCHFNKGENEKAINQIQSIKKDFKFFNCLSSTERRKVKVDLEKYTGTKLYY